MNNLLRRLLLLSLVLSLGCATSLVVSDTNERLPADTPVYVAVSADGAGGGKVYEGSGLLTTVAVAKALEPYTSSCLVGLSRETDEEALAAARRANAVYLFLPRIVRWDDRSTVSAKPQAAEISVDVLEVASGRSVSSARISGQSRVVLNTGTPQEQLAEPLTEWAGQLFLK